MNSLGFYSMYSSQLSKMRSIESLLSASFCWVVIELGPLDSPLKSRSSSVFFVYLLLLFNVYLLSFDVFFVYLLLFNVYLLLFNVNLLPKTFNNLFPIFFLSSYDSSLMLFAISICFFLLIAKWSSLRGSSDLLSLRSMYKIPSPNLYLYLKYWAA